MLNHINFPCFRGRRVRPGSGRTNGRIGQRQEAKAARACSAFTGNEGYTYPSQICPGELLLRVRAALIPAGFCAKVFGRREFLSCFPCSTLLPNVITAVPKSSKSFK